jgi:uncharacterized lipoprotein NlpE involved in copper resistance
MRIVKISNEPLLKPKRQQVTTVLVSLTLLCAAIFISACSPAVEAPNGISDDNVNMALASNSRNSLDWAGSYQGVLPCASCEGIETTLTLHANNTYQLESVYLGKDVDNRFQQSGIFSWDTKGSIITLDNIAGEARSFRVEEQGVRQLDLSGQMVTGSLAELYRLNKLPETVSQPSKVIAKFTDVDMNWFISGKGNMLKKDNVEGNILSDPIVPYQALTLNYKDAFDFARAEAEHHREMNTALLKVIEDLQKK